MPSWLSSLLEIFKGSDGQLDWPRIGGVIAALAPGGWAVYTFFAGRKKADEKNTGGTKVTQSGQGAASGGDMNIGVLNIGPSTEHIEQFLRPLTGQLAAKDSQIATLSAQVAGLTKLLMERNPAAAPGTEQAVGAAVQLIAQGAEEGDSLLEEAFKLLQQNKLGEAVPLLEAFAEDKTARAQRATVQAEKDRKEAAVAYRNLGAIAGLADPKRALEAYEKALALDPDDLESLYWAGAIQIDYGNLKKAEKRLERVQGLTKATNQAFYQYAALGTLGDIKQRRGDRGGALQSYRGTIPMISRLARSDPGNAGWQRDLSVSYDRIGGVQEAQGDLAGALKSYSDGLAISERLAKSDPGNAGWQRDLSVSYNKIGGVQQAQGDLAGALKSYSDSLAIRARLARSDPGNAGWQRDLSVSYNKIGGVQQAQGDLAGALKSYSDSLAIRARLARSDPGNAGWQRDLAGSFDKLANVHKQSGDAAKARDFFRQGQAIIAGLTKLSPDNAVWKNDLAWFDGQIAVLDQENAEAPLPGKGKRKAH